MQKDEAVKKMKLINEKFGNDKEMCHCEADDLLVEVLESLGYDELIKEYYVTEKWYA